MFFFWADKTCKHNSRPERIQRHSKAPEVLMTSLSTSLKALHASFLFNTRKLTAISALLSAWKVGSAASLEYSSKKATMDDNPTGIRWINSDLIDLNYKMKNIKKQSSTTCNAGNWPKLNYTVVLTSAIDE